MISVVGFVIAALIAITPPAGYFLFTYNNTVEILAFAARTRAPRIAKSAMAQHGLSQSRNLPLSELRLPRQGEQPLRQSVHDDGGRLIAEVDASLVPPVVARSAPIVVDGHVAGSFEVAASLRPMLLTTFSIALPCLLLAIAAYFAIRSLPLRVLDRILGVLNEAEGTLAAQNERLDAALANMAQGLCMFDADQRLVVFNRRMEEIFKIFRPASSLPACRCAT